MATFIWPVRPVSASLSGGATEVTAAAILADTATIDTNTAAIKTAIEILDDTVSTNVHTGLKELQITAKGHVCAENSTVVELAGGATFTGSAWQDCLDYGTIVVSVFADQASATNGLVVQWSADGTNIMDTDVFTISANVGKTFSFGTASRYIRVVYTNGATLQGTFILQTMLKPGYTKPSSHRLEDSLNGQDDAELVKAILAARNPAGNYLNIDCTTGGNLKVALEEVDASVTIPVSLDISALALESGGNLDIIAGDTTSLDAKVPALYNSTIPVTNIATDIPVAWDTKEYTDAATTITIVYKKSTATVATRTITWASAALKTAGALPASEAVVLAGA